MSQRDREPEPHEHELFDTLEVRARELCSDTNADFAVCLIAQDDNQFSSIAFRQALGAECKPVVARVLRELAQELELEAHSHEVPQ